MSTIDTCRLALSQDIQNLIQQKEPKDWVSALKASKPGHLVKLYESTVTFGIRDVAEEAFKALSKVKLEDKYKKRLKAAHTLFKANIAKAAAPASPPKLFIAKVTEKKEVKRLKEIMQTWDRIAKTKEHTAKRLEKSLGKRAQHFEKLGLAEDSVRLTKILNGSELKARKIKKDEFVYTASDETKKLHAITIATYDKELGYELCYLSTSPENVVVFDHEKAACRGAGTAVVRGLVQDIFTGKRDNKQLWIYATVTGVPFYEKLGFTKLENDPDFHFVLKHDQMDAFLKKHPETATAKSKAPKVHA